MWALKAVGVASKLRLQNSRLQSLVYGLRSLVYGGVVTELRLQRFRSQNSVSWGNPASLDGTRPGAQPVASKKASKSPPTVCYRKNSRTKSLCSSPRSSEPCWETFFRDFVPEPCSRFVQALVRGHENTASLWGSVAAPSHVLL